MRDSFGMGSWGKSGLKNDDRGERNEEEGLGRVMRVMGGINGGRRKECE